MSESFSAQDWVLIITAISILVNNAINNWKMNTKVNAINATAKVIEGHVNSATTKADERQQASVEREKALHETIVRLRTAADLLAQAAAIKDASRRNSDSGAAPVIIPIPSTIVDKSKKSTSETDIEKIAENLEITPKDK